MRNQRNSWAVVNLGEMPNRNIQGRWPDRGRIVVTAAMSDMAAVTTDGGIGAAPGESDACG